MLWWAFGVFLEGMMMRMLWVGWVVGLSLVAATPAVAGPRFNAWSGPAERSGQGGTKEDIDGVELWTMGDPPRSYTILGTVTFFHGGFGVGKLKPYGKLIRKYGGDAGIVVSSDRMGMGGYAVTPQIISSRGITQVQVMIVRYN